ncbi:MAG: hypothetical protein ACI82F_003581 [Planctomycetota bacterium]|jgi:hypothetical protein
MFQRLTSVIATLFLSGTVVWAYMPVPSPQPVTAAMLGQGTPPVLTCEDLCSDILELATDGAALAYQLCVTEAGIDYLEAVILCLNEPSEWEVLFCKQGAERDFVKDVDACLVAMNAADTGNIADWVACMELCL